MESFPIHLPLGDSCTLVYVKPNRKYGDKLGSELIELYGKRKRKPKTVEVKKNVITIPTGKLSSQDVKLLKRVEDKTGVRILNKREPRALKYMQNCTLKIPLSSLMFVFL
jgi:hypothetical protein